LNRDLHDVREHTIQMSHGRKGPGMEKSKWDQGPTGKPVGLKQRERLGLELGRG
jgi:hypothetical protein